MAPKDLVMFIIGTPKKASLILRNPKIIGNLLETRTDNEAN